MVIKNTSGLPVVCIQGLGFVGSAMATAVAASKNEKNEPRYYVVGIDLPTKEGKRRIEKINHGEFPFETSDEKLKEIIKQVHLQGNLKATTDDSVYESADIVVVDIHLDINWQKNPPSIELKGFEKAISLLGKKMKPGSMLLLETTVPPGTTKNIVVPIIEKELKKRNLSPSDILVAHSYERVMPGKNYFDSIVNYWRVYAGHTEEAADRCESFLKTIINTDKYPLTRLHNTTASELAKVLENTYRAVNIALMDEWAIFAESIGVDLFQVVEAIRMRPTHNNMRTPGFGVGGYCLTKDPLFGQVAAREIFDMDTLKFPFSSSAVQINQQTPIRILHEIEKLLNGLHGKTLILLGVSYRPDVGDTRYSPSETFYREAIGKGARVLVHDPIVKYWEEIGLNVAQSLPYPKHIDAIILAVPHSEYKNIDYLNWIGNQKPLFFDGFNVLSNDIKKKLKHHGCIVKAIGIGEES